MARRFLALLAVLLLLPAVPAHAGGPTSVLLSAPPHVTALGYDDPKYSQLMSLTDPSAARPEPDTGSHEEGAFVRATWLIHDMRVWRLSLIYPDAPGGPWIATTEIPGDSSPTWHRTTDPVALTKLLSDLKLLPGDRNGEHPRGGPTTYPQPNQAAPAPTPTTELAATTTFFTGWRWSLPGILLGAVIAVVAIRLLRPRRWDLTG
ncbi:hypothetical protein HPO96_35890 [Kribbella sandramycini]|uniref:Uncharacterized protein n=1 Tax=Kribbella sandramycini TaxID=60450 RepID=A0A7Y4L770_9ACTN|nr:hypothetical protein [Kribbella sandramycini]MBB6568870.1 hypothetical protein [Kribbella sandramycini]NOL45638.1 hypothetical protein [Kribbella sandramycini]